MGVQSIHANIITLNITSPCRRRHAICIPYRMPQFERTAPLLDSGPRRFSVRCGVKFRPCIDIHKGKVKQIVGSTLDDQKEGHSSLLTNFESDKPAGDYAKLYKDDGLTGGHVIMLGGDPLSKSAAIEALRAYPDFSSDELL